MTLIPSLLAIQAPMIFLFLFKVTRSTLRYPISRSKQQVIDMREDLSQQVWVDEKEVNECQLCDAPFSVVRRKVCVCVCV